MAELRGLWQKSWAAIHDLIQNPARGDVAWMQEKHPEVLKMSVSNAEKWFREQLSEARGTDQDSLKFTARELFMADDQNPKSVKFRSDVATVDLLNVRISSYQKALAKLPKRGLFSRKSEYEKTWEANLSSLIPERDAALTRTDTIKKWWDKDGAGIYREKEKIQHAQVDQRVASIEKNMNVWTRRQESTISVMQAECEKQRARQPHQKTKVKEPRQRGGLVRD